MYKIQNDYMDLEQIATSGQCFRWEKLSENSYRIPRLDNWVTVTRQGNEFEFSCNEEEFDLIWRNYFDLDTNYGEIISGIPREDTFLLNSAEYGRGIRILNQDLWEMIISFVVSQNNNIPRITKSLNCMCEKFNGFPTSKDLSKLEAADLAGLGLGYRDEYIIEAAKFWEQTNGCNDLAGLSYEDTMKELMKVKGIGKKVANCISLFGLHKLEACPVDTWIKKVIDEDYNGTMPQWMTSKWAGVYQQYVFYYKRINNKT